MKLRPWIATSLLAIVGFVAALAITPLAVAQVTGVDIHWTSSTFSCADMACGASILAYPDTHSNNSPKGLSVILADDTGCRAGEWDQTALPTPFKIVSDWYVAFEIETSGGFCQASVPWRIAYSHT